MKFRVAVLGDEHDLTGFRSGVDELDRWLQSFARPATAQGTRTYLLVDENNIVSGYFAIAPHLIAREKMPRTVGRGAPRLIPGILLAKLALAERLHGQGVGSQLLLQALATIIDAAREAGGKLVIVDAIDANATAFYARHNFVALPNRPDRLVMKLSTAARSLGMDWP